jgi:hypothetical protein
MLNADGLAEGDEPESNVLHLFEGCVASAPHLLRALFGHRTRH